MKSMRVLAIAGVVSASAVVATVATPARAHMIGIGSTKSSVVAQMTAVISKVVSANAGLQMRPQTMGGTQQYIPVVNAGQLEFGIGNMYQAAQAYRGIGLVRGPQVRQSADGRDPDAVPQRSAGGQQEQHQEDG